MLHAFSCYWFFVGIYGYLNPAELEFLHKKLKPGIFKSYLYIDFM